MTDEADRSDDKIEAAILDGIQRARRGKSLAFTGECHWCGTEVAMPAKFCDADCRDDYERDQKLRRLRGVIA